MSMVYLVTYGCKVNYTESEAVATLLERAGIAVQLISDGAISRVTDAGVFVVNSCAVTNMAEKKSRYGVAKIKKYHPGARIVTMGCAFGRKSPEQVAGEITGVLPTATLTMHRREKAFIKVQDGCQNFCSYCIIPYKRTRIVCRSIADVVAEINAQPAKVTEVVLCGINLCYYQDFAALCLAVDACGRAWSISSLEPPMVAPELIAVWQKCQHFVPRFHLCLQSGSDKILAAMNRHYTTAQFAAIVQNIRQAFPDAYLATDVIVGFPGETAADFAQTREFLRTLRLDHLHLFPYSPRPGTPAAKMKPVPNAIVTARLNELAAL